MCGTIFRPCFLQHLPVSHTFPDQPPVFARVCNSISGRPHFLGRALRKALSLNKNKASRRKSNTLLSVLLSLHSDRVVLGQVRLFQIRKSNRRQPLGDPLALSLLSPILFPPLFLLVLPSVPPFPPPSPPPVVVRPLKINSSSFCAETLPVLGLVIVLISSFLSFPEQVFYPVRRETLQYLISP